MLSPRFSVSPGVVPQISNEHWTVIAPEHNGNKLVIQYSTQQEAAQDIATAAARFGGQGGQLYAPGAVPATAWSKGLTSFTPTGPVPPARQGSVTTNVQGVDIGTPYGVGAPSERGTLKVMSATPEPGGALVTVHSQHVMLDDTLTLNLHVMVNGRTYEIKTLGTRLPTQGSHQPEFGVHLNYGEINELLQARGLGQLQVGPGTQFALGGVWPTLHEWGLDSQHRPGGTFIAP